MMPNIALLMLYEPFLSDEVGRASMLNAYESVLEIVHLIPSNMDVSYIMTSDLAL
jgi:hypothetical protein